MAVASFPGLRQALRCCPCHYPFFLDIQSISKSSARKTCPESVPFSHPSASTRCGRGVCHLDLCSLPWSPASRPRTLGLSSWQQPQEGAWEQPPGLPPPLGKSCPWPWRPCTACLSAPCPPLLPLSPALCSSHPGLPAVPPPGPWHGLHPLSGTFFPQILTCKLVLTSFSPTRASWGGEKSAED